MVVNGDDFFCAGPVFYVEEHVAAVEGIFEAAIMGPKKDQKTKSR